MRKVSDLKHSRTFNEKLSWLKLNGRPDEYTQLVDKYEVKDYVKSVRGGVVIIPTIGVWDRFQNIDFAELPEQCLFLLLNGITKSGTCLSCPATNKGKTELWQMNQDTRKYSFRAVTTCCTVGTWSSSVRLRATGISMWE